MKKTSLLILIVNLLVSPLALAKKEINLNTVILPTELKNLPKKSGSLYFSDSVKNEVLIPTNFWGEVKTSGLHYLPKGTTLIDGLSLAGGATGDADISEVQLTRNNGKTLESLSFDLSDGGDAQAHNFKLNSGDVVFLKKERFYENRAYYTTLVSVLATVLTGVVLYKRID